MEEFHVHRHGDHRQPAAPLFDEARLAIAGFLARYSCATRASYTTDLGQYFTCWCAQHDLEVFTAKRGHIELYAPSIDTARREERGRCSPLDADVERASSVLDFP